MLILGFAFHWQSTRAREGDLINDAVRARIDTALNRGRSGLWDWCSRWPAGQPTSTSASRSRWREAAHGSEAGRGSSSPAAWAAARRRQPTKLSWRRSPIRGDPGRGRGEAAGGQLAKRPSPGPGRARRAATAGRAGRRPTSSNARATPAAPVERPQQPRGPGPSAGGARPSRGPAGGACRGCRGSVTARPGLHEHAAPVGQPTGPGAPPPLGENPHQLGHRTRPPSSPQPSLHLLPQSRTGAARPLRHPVAGGPRPVPAACLHIPTPSLRPSCGGHGADHGPLGFPTHRATGIPVLPSPGPPVDGASRGSG